MEVISVATRHTDHTEDVLDEECGVKSDKQQPEVDFSKSLIQHLSGELGPPEVESSEHGKHDCSKDNVVEVCNHEVGVRDVEVHGWAGQDHPGQSTKEEGHEES